MEEITASYCIWADVGTSSNMKLSEMAEKLNIGDFQLKYAYYQLDEPTYVKQYDSIILMTKVMVMFMSCITQDWCISLAVHGAYYVG